MKTLLTYLLLLLISNQIWSANEHFQEANELYQNGKYEEALNTYLQQEKQSEEISKSLYFNMGNCYYKLTNYAMAILYYEKAKKLFGTDNDIETNLALANSKTLDKIAERPSFSLFGIGSKIRNLYSEKLWGVITIFISLLFSLALFLFFINNKVQIRKISFYSALVLFILLFASYTFGYQKKKELIRHMFAIVTTPSVNVKSEPQESGTTLYVIHEGLKVELLNEMGEWSNISLPDKKQGWIKTKFLMPI